jgi:hypothetical protein
MGGHQGLALSSMTIVIACAFIMIQVPTFKQGRFSKKEVMGELHAM